MDNNCIPIRHTYHQHHVHQWWQDAQGSITHLSAEFLIFTWLMRSITAQSKAKHLRSQHGASLKMTVLKNSSISFFFISLHLLLSWPGTNCKIACILDVLRSGWRPPLWKGATYGTQLAIFKQMVSTESDSAPIRYLFGNRAWEPQSRL